MHFATPQTGDAEPTPSRLALWLLWTDTSQRQGLGIATFHMHSHVTSNDTQNPIHDQSRLHEAICDLGLWMGSWRITHQWPYSRQNSAFERDCWLCILFEKLVISIFPSILSIYSMCSVSSQPPACLFLSLEYEEECSQQYHWLKNDEENYVSFCFLFFCSWFMHLANSIWWITVHARFRLEMGWIGGSAHALERCGAPRLAELGWLLHAHDLGVLPWSISRNNSYWSSDPHLPRMLHSSLFTCGVWINILPTHRKFSHDTLLGSFIWPILSCIIDVEHEISGRVRHWSISSLRGQSQISLEPSNNVLPPNENMLKPALATMSTCRCGREISAQWCWYLWSLQRSGTAGSFGTMRRELQLPWSTKYAGHHWCFLSNIPKSDDQCQSFLWEIINRVC